MANGVNTGGWGPVGSNVIDASGETESEDAASQPVERRWARPIALLPAVVVLLYVPGSLDGMADVRLLATAMVVTLVGWRALRDGWWDERRRLGPAGVAAGVFLAAAVFATITSDRPMLSLIGADQRQNGLLVYVVGVGLCALITAVVPLRAIAGAAKALPVAISVAVLYWRAQLAGFDPLGSRPPTNEFATPNPFWSTIGNPNFSGVMAAFGLTAAMWAASRTGLAWRWRLWWLVVAALNTWGIIGSDALQAPLAAAAGVGVLIVAMVAGRSRRYAMILLAGAGVVVVVAAVGLAELGPLKTLGQQETMVSRTWDWTAAARMARAQPLTGFGLARFGGYVREYRPPGDILNYGWGTQGDAAHSVPLDMAAGGGLPLFAAYAVFVLLVGWRLLQGLRTAAGEQLLLLGCVGGIWTAYQAQSLVSIDMSYLALMHFFTAGAVLAVTAVQPLAVVTGGARDVNRARRTRFAARIIAASTALLTLIGLTRITAAEFIGRQAMQADEQTVDGTASRLWRTSMRLYPWQSTYPYWLGYLYDANGATEAALDAFLLSLRQDPVNLTVLLNAVDAARRLERYELAWTLMRRALRIEPQAAEIKVLAAQVAIEAGHDNQVQALVNAALAFDPSNFEARELRDQLEFEQP